MYYSRIEPQSGDWIPDVGDNPRSAQIPNRTALAVVGIHPHSQS